MSAIELIDMLVSPRSFVAWDQEVRCVPSPLTPDYEKALEEARLATGLDEAVVTGEGIVCAHRVALAACEFGFLGGSVGVSAAERLVRCFERATEERLPLLALPASGGIRMHEGTMAFLQIAKISAALMRQRAAGLPVLVYLRHPSTGGTLASWGSLGHVTFAQPGALVGFLGPRVYEAIKGERLSEDVQRAENVFAHGQVDGIVEPERLAETFAKVLRTLPHNV